MPLIAIDKLDKIFATADLRTYALRAITLTVERGEYVSIAGPSGCGKSTLLSIIGLLDTPSAGSYRLDGAPVETLSSHDRAAIRNRTIGFIFQGFNLIGDLSVEENVELPLTYGKLSARERRRRVAEALERVRMVHRRRHHPALLSGGEQQRVAVARALAGRPAVMLADEPTGNLDSQNGAAVMDLLAELHRDGSTIVTVTHDVRFAGCAQRTIHLLDGSIVGEAASLRTNGASVLNQ